MTRESSENRDTIKSSQEEILETRGPRLRMHRPQVQGSSRLEPNESESSGTSVDISEIRKKDNIENTRAKFDDIFRVDSSGEAKYDDNINVAGRLSQPSHVAFFEEIGAPDFILNTLKNGHSSTLSGPVPSYERRNNRSFYEHEEFAVNEVKRLISLGRVEVVSEKPYIVNPLSVAVQRNKNRLILDCTYLNEFVVVPDFKYENEKVALDYFREGCYMTGWDLRDGYHHILINEKFREYLGFKLTLDGKNVYCRYKVGPFGLRDLPWLFSKFFRVLVKRWRGLGLKTINF